MSQFAFLDLEWPALYEAASRAEETVHADPRTACFYARRALEIAVSWAYKHDTALKLPYQDNLSALIHDPTFKQTAGEAVFNKARVITTLGNHAVHSQRAVAESDAQAAVTELFHVAYWFARMNRPGFCRDFFFTRPACAGPGFDCMQLRTVWGLGTRASSAAGGY